MTLPTVVLTGASAGIGFATLEALESEARVIAVSRTRPASSHANCVWVQGDLRAPEAIARSIVGLLQSNDEPLDGVIHCAVSYGSDQRHPFVETREAEWDELMDVNVRSQFILTQRLLPLLSRRRRAFIVALTSDAGTQPAPERIAYGCSKAASYALFAGLAAELSASSVSVIQMMPAGQVVTRGMRRRRPADFAFVGYSPPEIFREPMLRILRNRGEGLNGACLVVQ